MDATSAYDMVMAYGASARSERGLVKQLLNVQYEFDDTTKYDEDTVDHEYVNRMIREYHDEINRCVEILNAGAPFSRRAVVQFDVANKLECTVAMQIQLAQRCLVASVFQRSQDVDLIFKEDVPLFSEICRRVGAAVGEYVYRGVVFCGNLHFYVGAKGGNL